MSVQNVSSLFFVVLLFSQLSVRGDAKPTSKDYFVSDLGAHHRTWMKIEPVTNHVGEVVLHTNTAYVEIATGLNYRDATTGEWLESDPAFDLSTKSYAIATRCQHRVVISANLGDTNGVVDLETPDGKRLRSSILGLTLFDPVSGNSLQIAAARDVAGTLVSSNEIVWVDAFEGLKADVRVRNERGEFHQDVLLREKLSSEQLASLGFDPASVRLQTWTEFFESPPPAVATTVLKSETNAVLRATMAEPDQTEDLLDFGEMKMPQGRAFVEEANGAEAGIFKQWREIDGRRFLIENASYADLLPLLESLPVKTAALKSRRSGLRYASSPAPPERMRTSLAAHAFQITRADGKMLAANSPQVVLDYVIVTSQANYTFCGDQTYYVNGNVNLTGTTTFEGGTVIKYAANKTINIISPGIAKTTAAAYRPVIFTAKDDNTVGETISGSTGNPLPGVYYANPAFDLRTVGNPGLNNLRFAYAQQAITLGSGITLTLTDAQFVKCNFGIGAGYYQSMTVKLRNALFSQVQKPFELSLIGGGATISAEHVTFDSATALVQEGYTAAYGLGMTNCVFANVATTGWAGSPSSHLSGRNNGFFLSSFYFGTDTVIVSVNPFQTAGAGNFYLTTNPDGTDASGFRNRGLTQLAAPLGDDLKSKTTHPPLPVTGTSGTLAPRNIRDADTPDLGYHYTPLDYSISGISGTFTFMDGVAIGIHGAHGFYAGTLVSLGTPKKRNQIALYSAVQEQPVPWVANASATYLMNSWSDGTQLRFTDVSLAGGAGFFTWASANLVVKDCALHGAKLNITSGNGASAILRFTNNIIERCTWTFLYCGGPYWGEFYNNLFLNTSFGIGHACGLLAPNFTVKNNLFVNSSVTHGAGTPQISHNGYCNSTWTTKGANYRDITSPPDFVTTGPLGPYYYPATGGNLSQLIDTGTGTPAQMGLYHYTTQTSQAREGVTPVDIGFHYAADNDGDGLGDPWEVERGLSPDIASDLHGPSGDPDGDGLTTLQEYLGGTSPVRPNAQNVSLSGLNYKRLTVAPSFAATTKAYDVYFRLDTDSPWQRVASGIPGQIAFTFVNPDPSNEHDFIFLDAADDDGDGLSNGYENWFTYSDSQGVTKRTNPLMVYSLSSVGDYRKDGWKVTHSLNPMDTTGVNAPTYQLGGDPYNSKQKHDLYYAAPAQYSAAYDPLRLTGSAAVRPIATISQPIASAFNIATFAIQRDVGSSPIGTALVVYFSVGGDLVNQRDYKLIPPSGITLNDQASPFSVTIPSGSSSVEITIAITPTPTPATALRVALVSFDTVP